MILGNLVHPTLLATMQLVYTPNKLECFPQIEKESAQYGAASFEINGRKIIFRVAKITPTKIGQFVTFWRRVKNGPIQPYDILDPFDLFVISVCKDDYFGQFVFPKSILSKHDIISIGGEGGKRAIRVYPPWDKTLSKQARKTQEWQIEYFLEISPTKSVDDARFQKLYSLA